MRIIALEGPSCSGKTSAIAALAKDASLGRTVVFDCYVREIASPQDVPPARTSSRAEQIAAFRTFMDIEQRRVLRTRRLSAAPEPPDLLILDRSVDTLLAHAHALDTLFGFGAHRAVTALLPRLPHLAPQFTIYLDADVPTLRARRPATAISRDALFLHDPAFLTSWRDYFLGAASLTITPKVVAVPADAEPTEVVARIRELL